jgi:hypothetical protein
MNVTNVEYCPHTNTLQAVDGSPVVFSGPQFSATAMAQAEAARTNRKVKVFSQGTLFHVVIPGAKRNRHNRACNTFRCYCDK